MCRTNVAIPVQYLTKKVCSAKGSLVVAGENLEKLEKGLVSHILAALCLILNVDQAKLIIFNLRIHVDTTSDDFTKVAKCRAFVSGGTRMVLVYFFFAWASIAPFGTSPQPPAAKCGALEQFDIACRPFVAS